jgi:hypothetical protein
MVTRCADMNKGRQAQGICTIGNSIYVVGGLCNNVYLKDCERYDMLANVWIALPASVNLP